MKIPDISDLRRQFELDSAEGGKAKESAERNVPKHILVCTVDECSCAIYVHGTLAVLAELGRKEEEIHHINDRTQIRDFPLEGDVLECLSDMAGFEVTPDHLLWEVARGVCLSAGVSEDRKFVPRYDMAAGAAYVVK